MNFLSMKYFLTLAEERSFTRAAERLHITQQTLSAHMAGLEKEVGMKLLVRRVPLELTDGGEVFYRYARIFQRNELSLRRELSDVSGSESGILRIGIAPSRGQVVLPRVIELFHRTYPHVRLVLSEMANASIWNALKRDEIDLALAFSGASLPGIMTSPFWKENLVLLLSQDLRNRVIEENPLLATVPWDAHILSYPTFLGECPFLLNSEDDIAGAWARKLFHQANCEPHVLVESENMGTMLQLCVQGMGAYFCPENLAQAMLSPTSWQALQKIPIEGGSYVISFGYQENSHRWSMIGNFMEIAKEAMRNGGQ